MPLKYKVGDVVKMKAAGSEFELGDAAVVAGRTGMIMGATDVSGCSIPSPYDYRIDFGSSFESGWWWVGEEDIESLVGVTHVLPPTGRSILPTDAKERKNYPLATGVIDYFPAALAEVAKISKIGNDQHNPGQPLHWARNKSTDQADTIMRHFLERGTIDSADGQRHSAKLAWRALALLQLELEAEGAPVARGASYDTEKK